MKAKYRNGDINITPSEEDQTEKPLTTKEAATRLGRSEWWTRDYFRRVADTLKYPSLDARRGTRQYVTVTIPIRVFEREKAKFEKLK